MSFLEDGEGIVALEFKSSAGLCFNESQYIYKWDTEQAVKLDCPSSSVEYSNVCFKAAFNH